MVDINKLSYASNAIKKQLENNYTYEGNNIPHNETSIFDFITNTELVKNKFNDFKKVSTEKLPESDKQLARKKIISILLEQLNFAKVGVNNKRAGRQSVYLDKINNKYKTDFQFEQLIKNLDKYSGKRFTVSFSTGPASGAGAAEGSQYSLTIRVPSGGSADDRRISIDISQPLTIEKLHQFYEFIRDVCEVPLNKLENYENYRDNMISANENNGVFMEEGNGSAEDGGASESKEMDSGDS